MKSFKLVDKGSIFHDGAQPDKTITGDKIIELAETPNVDKAKLNKVIVEATEDEVAAYKSKLEDAEKGKVTPSPQLAGVSPEKRQDQNPNADGSAPGADNATGTGDTTAKKMVDYNTEEWTLVTIKAELDKRKIDHNGVTLKADLAKLLHEDDKKNK